MLVALWCAFGAVFLKEPSYRSSLVPNLPPEAQEVKMKMSKLSYRQKIGQLLITTLESTTLAEEEKILLQNGEISGFMLLNKNIKNPDQLKELTAAIAKQATLSGIKPFIAVDQEGGRVSRIPWIDTTAQSEITTYKEAVQVAVKRGKELKDLGINVNFAPVVETTGSTVKTSFIERQGRAFTANSAKLATAMVEGYKKIGIIPVAKHFPGGLGYTVSDPHQVLPKINLDKTELATDLKAFKQVIDSGAGAVMVTHLMYPHIDPAITSASPYFIADLLRGELQFSGVVVVDDVTMKAVTSQQKLDEFVLQSFTAGADLFIVSDLNNYRPVCERLEAAFDKEDHLRKRLEDSVERVLILKERLE
ncbi:MAG: glycoside hydrolase family 3 N-terminal domain-containing protein [Patescibacteria group bacterium]